MLGYFTYCIDILHWLGYDLSCNVRCSEVHLKSLQKKKKKLLNICESKYLILDKFDTLLKRT